MAVIWKYQFAITEVFDVSMPVGAVPLHAELQDGMPTLWAQINPNAVRAKRRFRVIGTGHAFDPDRLQFVATFQQPPFVWHLFEVIE